MPQSLLFTLRCDAQRKRKLLAHRRHIQLVVDLLEHVTRSGGDVVNQHHAEGADEQGGQDAAEAAGLVVAHHYSSRKMLKKAPARMCRNCLSSPTIIA